MSTDLYVAVGVGGAVGAPSRYLLDRFVSTKAEADIPWGTLIINVTGSFALGFLSGLALTGNLAPLAKAIFGTGFCGAYTTFSTFSYETVRLLEDGQVLEAFSYAAISLLLGLAAAAAGLAVGLWA